MIDRRQGMAHIAAPRGDVVPLQIAADELADDSRDVEQRMPLTAGDVEDGAADVGLRPRQPVRDTALLAAHAPGQSPGTPA